MKEYKSPIEIITSRTQEQKDSHILQCITQIGVNINKEELIKALQYDRHQYEKGYKDGYDDGIAENSMYDALVNIVWYNSHYEWLERLADELEDTTGYYINPFNVNEWHTEKHFIWMLLVGMFGDWGTSIRGGWIEKTKECAKFIRDLCAKAKDDGSEELI